MRRTPITVMPSDLAACANDPPMSPTPMISTVLPAVVGVKMPSQWALRWLVRIAGMRAFSIRNIIRADWRILSTWIPELLVNVNPGWIQSSGSSGSMPAPMTWIQRSLGAARLRSASGNFGSRNMSFDDTRPSAVASQSSDLRSSPSVVRTPSRPLRASAAAIGAATMRNTSGLLGRVSKWICRSVIAVAPSSGKGSARWVRPRPRSPW